jgi:hypothetical protein
MSTPCVDTSITRMSVLKMQHAKYARVRTTCCALRCKYRSVSYCNLVWLPERKVGQVGKKIRTDGMRSRSTVEERKTACSVRRLKKEPLKGKR